MDYFKDVREVARIEGLPPLQMLIEEYLVPGTPVVITGALAGTKLAEWSPQYLKERIGGTQVEVYFAEGGRYEIEKREMVTKKEMRMNQFIDDIVTKERGRPGEAYLKQTSIPRLFPELIPEVPVAHFVDPRLVAGLNLWMGPEKTVTPLHYDLLNNFLIQTHGTKKLILFGVDQSSFVYPSPVSSQFPHVSPVDPENPDLETYPLLREATPHVLELYAGEVLVLPPGHWHQVTGLTASVSVNIWWKLLDVQMLNAHYLRALRSVYGRPPNFFRGSVRHRFNSFHDYAKALRASGEIEASFLCHLMLLDGYLADLGPRHCIRVDRSLKGVDAPVKMLELLQRAQVLSSEQAEELERCFELGRAVLAHEAVDSVEMERALDSVASVVEAHHVEPPDTRPVLGDFLH